MNRSLYIFIQTDIYITGIVVIVIVVGGGGVDVFSTRTTMYGQFRFRNVATNNSIVCFINIRSTIGVVAIITQLNH